MKNHLDECKQIIVILRQFRDFLMENKTKKFVGTFKLYAKKVLYNVLAKKSQLDIIRFNSFGMLFIDYFVSILFSWLLIAYSLLIFLSAGFSSSLNWKQQFVIFCISVFLVHVGNVSRASSDKAYLKLKRKYAFKL